MNERITELRDLDGLSIKDAKRMPHPVDLKRWERQYEIDINLGVFKVVRRPSE